MCNKKRFLPILILTAAILAATVYSLLDSIVRKPVITEGAFPFSITYELDGETVTICEVYKARYVGNKAAADADIRVYVGEIGNRGEDNTVYLLKKDANTRVELWTHLHPDYLLGDPNNNYLDAEALEPKIYYFDSNETEYRDAETLAAHGVKLVSFSYPTPLENKLVFSHMAHLSGAVVFPLLLITLLSLLAILIFVRKEKQLKYKALDIISIVANWVIGSVYMPFVTMLALLIDLEGGGPALYYQLLYFIPAFSVLCIALSVALRRKGYGAKALIATLIGPVVFMVYCIVFYGGGSR